MNESVYMMHNLFGQGVIDDDGAWISVDGSMCIGMHAYVLRIC